MKGEEGSFRIKVGDRLGWSRRFFGDIFLGKSEINGKFI